MARTILVADDNRQFLKMLSRVFEIEAEYDLCAQAANGREAIALAIQHRPELIILDLAMPEVNGIEASVELKQIMPDIPIIILTQYAEIAKAMPPAGLPFDRVVSKADAAELMDHVKSLLPA